MNCATSTSGGPPGRAGVRSLDAQRLLRARRRGRRTLSRARGRARAGRRGRPPHLDELQLEPRGGLLTQGRQDVGPAHLTAGLLGEGLEVRSEQAQLGIAGGQVAREPRHRGEIVPEAPGRRQHAREEDREQDEHAGQRDEGEAPAPAGSGDPVPATTGRPGRDAGGRRESACSRPPASSQSPQRQPERLEEPRSGRPRSSAAWRASISTAVKGSISSSGAPSPSRSASHRPR